jgi:hypothetical protein
MAAKERALDSEFLEDVLGLEWQDLMRKAQERAREACETPQGREASLRQAEANLRSLQDLATRMEEAAREETSAAIAEHQDVSMVTPENVAAGRALMMETTPVPAPYRLGMGCQATATMISEVRMMRRVAQPPPAAPAPSATPSQEAVPQHSRPERNHPRSWGAVLAVFVCIIAAGVSASAGDANGQYACLFWIFVAIPLVLIHFRRRGKAA